MSNTQNFLDQIMDFTDLPGVGGEELVVYKPLELTDVESNPQDRTIDLNEDYAKVRKTLDHQQQMLFDAAKVMLETAKNADSPRHMEVFATLMGQMTTTSKEILKLHKEMKDITSENVSTQNPGDNSGVNIQNAQVFVGGPTELMDKLGDAFETKNLNVVDEQ
ncbi:terminase small subunit [Acinetobacter phage ZZ1]|jgi:hypothetical protein|uniref:Terminase DNA packaging enzyme small subunit n=3 Tax=Caudoviricetes TaxID=2731619 RepID=A0A410T5M9_9CAUD|nr:terminase small subunit [Acinetobacter phage ZZ1]AEJ90231.1 terminase DNA packaging enzyme small subunit [Acinetobacter phage ZZ1]QAU04031.1 terminase DNA packaging enzyme small subunit [Acinetobacter phage Henu6]